MRKEEETGNWKLQQAACDVCYSFASLDVFFRPHALQMYKYVRCNRIINKHHKSFEYLNNSICELKRDETESIMGVKLEKKDILFSQSRNGMDGEMMTTIMIASSQDKFSRPIN